ncbi:unnamed protein product [Linum trigynum]|uniref:Glycosyltransferase n=1 Tax=Linum trigynum TaxID=586398 RepID=A0AAV2G4B9_9ROSI
MGENKNWYSSSSSSSGEHIVMLPLMTQGHLIPFLSLARQIIRRRATATVTIATTPINLDSLRRSLSDEPANIHIAELPFPADLLTDNSTSTPESRLKLYRASLDLESPVRDLLRRLTPRCLISDVFLGWATATSESLGIQNFTFTTCGAYGSLGYMSVWMNLPHRKQRIADADGEEYFSIPGFPENYRFRMSQLPQIFGDADGKDPWSEFFRPQIAGSMESAGWLCNTVEEFEGSGLELLRRFVNRPVWAVGPLVPPVVNGPNEIGNLCREWLQAHGPGTVLYICFGSQNSPTPSQMIQLATALEQISVPFVWAGRGFEEGFAGRVSESGKGILIHEWAPQMEILSHASTGAFLSHCGWNSVLESLSQGVPIVAWPLAAEQGFNAKMLVEEMGVAVDLAGFETAEVKRAVEKAMGAEMRRKAAAVAEGLRMAVRDDDGEDEKGSSVRSIDEFLGTVLRKANC